MNRVEFALAGARDHPDKLGSDSNIKSSEVFTSRALAMARMFLNDGFRRPLSMPER